MHFLGCNFLSFDYNFNEICFQAQLTKSLLHYPFQQYFEVNLNKETWD